MLNYFTRNIKDSFWSILTIFKSVRFFLLIEKAFLKTIGNKKYSGLNDFKRLKFNIITFNFFKYIVFFSSINVEHF